MRKISYDIIVIGKRGYRFVNPIVDKPRVKHEGLDFDDGEEKGTNTKITPLKEK